MSTYKLRRPFPRSLFRSALDSIQDLTLSAAKDATSYGYTRDTVPSNKIAYKQFQQLTQVVLPHTVAYDVSCSMLEALALFIANMPCTGLHHVSKYDDYKVHLRQLINSALYLGTHMLVMEDMPFYMQLVLCRNLPKLKNLRKLKLGHLKTDREVAEIRELLYFSFGALKKLVVFTFERNCNDDTLKALAQNCKKLERLNVNFSKDVTDSSIEWIGKFSKLKSLNIWQTFITREKAVQLLYILPLLETFATDHEGVLKDNVPDKLQLRKYVTSSCTVAKTLAVICPYLNTITIYACRCDLSPLAALKCLQHMSYCHSTFDDIEKYLEAGGSNLISLSLREVWCVDIRFITFCTKLKKLDLISSTYCRHSIGASYDYTTPHFQSLEALSIKCYNESNMKHFLLGYKNLKFLILHDIGEPIDELLLKAISLGCLLNLEVVNIGMLFGMSTFEQLLNSCRNLKLVLRNREILISEDSHGLHRLKSKLKDVKLKYFSKLTIEVVDSEDEYESEH